ncbi:hypothetical protein [Sulfodiicoccus acidiphilus]|nr:hypothetical protein [Sulfodiicoccus acidiphilus]
MKLSSRVGLSVSATLLQWFLLFLGEELRPHLRFLPFLNLLRPGDPSSFSYFFNVFLGDLGIGVLSLAPIVGEILLVAVDFNTGTIIGRGSLPLALLLKLMGLPSSWLELGALGLLAAEGMALTTAVLRGRLVRELEVLWKVFLISTYLLLGSAFLEVAEEALRSAAALSWVGFVPFALTAALAYKWWTVEK